jgi:hypothetical protein
VTILLAGSTEERAWSHRLERFDRLAETLLETLAV